MKKRFLKRAQAVAMAVCLTVNTLNITAYATEQADTNQTEQTTEDTTGNITEDTTGNITEGTTDSTTEDTTGNITEGTTDSTTEDTTDNTTEDTTDSTTDGSTDDKTDNNSSDNTEENTGNESEETENGNENTNNEADENTGETDNSSADNVDDNSNAEADNDKSDAEKSEEDAQTEEKSEEDKLKEDKLKEDKKKTKESKEEVEAGPTSYYTIDYDVKSVEGKGELASYKASLASSYDSRNSGCITSIKNQNPYGTCWAFAAMAASEAAIVKRGLANSEIDLSEFHTVYFTYNPVTDPLGNTAGDRLITSTPYDGGNNMFTTFSLASWTGAVGEIKAPYSSLVADEGAKLNNNLAYNDDYHLQNSYWINMGDTDDVKAAIVKYGAVSAVYYHSNTYLNSTTYAYCSPSSLTTGGHAIALVGWDDNYSKDNFNSSCRPSSNGAWLVKNSWDSWWGNEGYFWISYEDANINSDPAIVYDYDNAANYDHNYQYDGMPGISAYGLYNNGSIANVFTTKGNSKGSERLDAVSFAISDTNAKYSIQIYTALKDSNDPTSGTKMLSTPQTGTTSYEGYYTVKLNNPITIAEGTKFSVVITLSKSSSDVVYYFAEKSFDYGWIKGVCSSSAGQSFAQMSPGQGWIDLNSGDITARIKAFTTDVDDIVPTAIKLDRSSLSLNIGSTAKFNVTFTPSNTTLKKLTWKSSNTSVAVVDSNGKVTAKGIGTATITATASSGVKANCSVTVPIGKVAGLKSPSQSTSSIKLQWTKQNGVSGYEIYRYDSRTKKYTKLKTASGASATKYTDKKRRAGTSYKYKVRAYKKSGSKKIYGSYSSVLTTATETTKPSIKITAGTKKAAVKWSKVSGASGYEVYMSTKKSSGYSKVKTLSKSSQISYTKSGLKKGKTYYFKVRTYKKIGSTKIYSSFSSVKSVKVKK